MPHTLVVSENDKSVKVSTETIELYFNDQSFILDEYLPKQYRLQSIGIANPNYICIEISYLDACKAAPYAKDISKYDS